MSAILVINWPLEVAWSAPSFIRMKGKHIPIVLPTITIKIIANPIINAIIGPP